MCFSPFVIILIDVKIVPSLGNGRLFKWVPESVSLLRDFAFFLAFWYVYISKATLDLSWPRPRISHFFKKCWFVYWKIILEPTIHVLGVSLFRGLFSEILRLFFFNKLAHTDSSSSNSRLHCFCIFPLWL